MRKKEIQSCLEALEEKLSEKGVKGEICLYGGAVMCLVYDARPATKDVDAIFEPTKIIREAAQEVAQEFKIKKKDWLNDGVKGFLVKHDKKILFRWPHLKVYHADPKYLIAMKALAARTDATDRKDIIFLIKKLKIRSAAEVFNIIEDYYPRKRIKPATQFFIEEIFEK